MNDFELKREKWLKEVAEGCHELATEFPDGPDFYVFQSRSDLYSPELLIIGANPGGAGKYRDSEPFKNKGCRDLNDLGYNSNQYIDEEFNKNWHIKSQTPVSRAALVHQPVRLARSRKALPTLSKKTYVLSVELVRRFVRYPQLRLLDRNPLLRGGFPLLGA